MIHLYRCYPPDILRVDICDLSGSNQSPPACTRSYGPEGEILHLIPEQATANSPSLGSHWKGTVESALVISISCPD